MRKKSRANGMLPDWDVLQMGYRAFGLSRSCNVALLTGRAS